MVEKTKNAPGTGEKETVVDRNMVVTVNRPSAIHLPQCAESDKQMEQEGQPLSPGQNDVSESYWEFCKENPGVKKLIQSGILSCKGAGKAEPLIEDWSKVSVVQAKKVIENITDLQLLTKIKKSAKRKAIIDAAQARVVELTTEAETEA